MRIGKMPKSASDNSFEMKLDEICRDAEVFLFACQVRLTFKLKLFAISNHRCILLDPTSLEIGKEVEISDVKLFKRTAPGFQLKYKSSQWVFASDKNDAIAAEEAMRGIGIRCDTSIAAGLSDSQVPVTKRSESGIDSIIGINPPRREPPRTQPVVSSQKPKVIAKGNVGNTKVEIYENGYVSINNQHPEKLIGISSSINVSKKTGAGRAIGQGALILGSGFLLSGGTSNRRGDVYLIIVTEYKSHTLKEDLNSFSAAKKGYESEATVLRLEAAGNAVLSAPTPLVTAADSNSQSGGNTLADELTKLAALHKQGLLSDEEFASAKAKLIG